jgi:hypothetical protein
MLPDKGVVTIEVLMASQTGQVMAKGTAEVELPIA